MKLAEYLDRDELKRLIDAGYISCRLHPTVPITVYNYTQQATLEGFFPEIVCKCRGLQIDIDENIVARPFYKFWNLGQKEATIEALVEAQRAYGQPLELTKKMDGQLGILWNFGTEWGISTRGSYTSDGAMFATQKFLRFVKYGATEFVPKGWTLLFEIIAKHLRIVVPYDFEGLVLTGAVNIETGREMCWEELYWLHCQLNQYATDGKPWCRLVEKTDMNLLEAQQAQTKGEEGWVVTAHRGDQPPLKAKIKYEDYLRLHRLITNVTPQMIWDELCHPMKAWVNHEVDQMSVPVHFRQWVTEWNDKLHQQFHAELIKVIEAVNAVNKHHRGRPRDVRMVYLKALFPEVANLAISMLDGKVSDVYTALWRRVRPVGREGACYVEGASENEDKQNERSETLDCNPLPPAGDNAVSVPLAASS